MDTNEKKTPHIEEILSNWQVSSPNNDRNNQVSSNQVSSNRVNSNQVNNNQVNSNQVNNDHNNQVNNDHNNQVSNNQTNGQVNGQDNNPPNKNNHINEEIQRLEKIYSDKLTHMEELKAEYNHIKEKLLSSQEDVFKSLQKLSNYKETVLLNTILLQQNSKETLRK